MHFFIISQLLLSELPPRMRHADARLAIAQAIAVEGTRRMHVHVFFSRPEAKKAEGELDLEWMEKSVVKTAPWWKFWAW